MKVSFVYSVLECRFWYLFFYLIEIKKTVSTLLQNNIGGQKKCFFRNWCKIMMFHLVLFLYMLGCGQVKIVFAYFCIISNLQSFEKSFLKFLYSMSSDWRKNRQLLAKIAVLLQNPILARPEGFLGRLKPIKLSKYFFLSS